jgi:hypothetical protein
VLINILEKSKYNPMAFSRHSLRRVIGDMVNRHNGKNDTINSSSTKPPKNNNRSRKKSDRNSIISNGSLSVCTIYI